MLVVLLEKDECLTGLDLKQLTELSGLIEAIPEISPIVDSLSTATGYYGVFSGFKKY